MGLEGLDTCTAELTYNDTTITLASATMVKKVKTDGESTHLNILLLEPEWDDRGREKPTDEEIRTGKRLADRIDVTKKEILINCHSGVFRSAIVAIHLLVRLGADLEEAKRLVFEAQGKGTNKAHKERVNQFF